MIICQRKSEPYLHPRRHSRFRKGVQKHLESIDRFAGFVGALQCDCAGEQQIIASFQLIGRNLRELQRLGVVPAGARRVHEHGQITRLPIVRFVSVLLLGDPSGDARQNSPPPFAHVRGVVPFAVVIVGLGRGEDQIGKCHRDARMARDQRESGIASGLWRQMSQRFFAVVNGAHQRLRMTRCFRLRDVVIQRLEVIVRVVRQRAQPAECVGIESAVWIALAKSLEFPDRDFARVSQRFFVLRRLLQFARG